MNFSSIISPMHMNNLRMIALFIIWSLSIVSCRQRGEQFTADLKGGGSSKQILIPQNIKVCRKQVPSPPDCLDFQAKIMSPSWNDSLILAYISRLTYQENDIIEEHLKNLNLEYHGSIGMGPDQAIVVGGDNFLIVAFRGTDLSIQDIMTDSKFLYGNFMDGFTHRGFTRAFARLKDGLYKKIAQINKGRAQPMQIWFTGHSLGGAIANLSAFDFATTTRQKVLGLQTFGSPRVFSPGLVDMGSTFIQNDFRFVYENDIVTNLPGPVFFRHSGDVVYLTDDCSVKGQEDGWLPFLARLAKQNPVVQLVNFNGVTEHRLENYIHCLETIALGRKEKG